MADWDTIRKRNLDTPAATSAPPVRWSNPGQFTPPGHRSIADRYAHPDWDTVAEGLTPPSWSVTDHCWIQADGLYHMYVTAQCPGSVCLWPGQHNCVMHGTSPDLADWTFQHPAIWVQADNSWENTHIWPPFVIANPSGGYEMIYTGMDRDDCQCLCQAHSDDLFSFRRTANNPIIPQAGFDWMWHRDDGKIRHCRDPHVERTEQGFLLYYTTLCADGATGVGLMGSDDLATWHDLGPCYKHTSEQGRWLAESPLVIALGHGYVLWPMGGPNHCPPFTGQQHAYLSSDPTRFFDLDAIPVDVSDTDGVIAPEVVRPLGSTRWLISFYNGGMRIYFGVLTLDEKGFAVSQIRTRTELESVLAGAAAAL